MNRHVARSALAVIAAFGSMSQIPQFRTGATGVSLHVIVRRDGQPVRDLSVTDFEVTDSMVTQSITAVDAASVPLDVSVVAEEATYGRYLSIASFDREMEAVARLAAPTDRVHVVLAGDDQREQPVGRGEDLQRAAAVRKTCSPVYDALARTLMRRVDSNRQHVIVLLSAGEGSGSILSAAQVTDVARRSSARLYTVSIDPQVDVTRWRQWVSSVRCSDLSRDWSPDRQARLRQIDATPSVDRQHRELWLGSKNRLAQIAELTGGAELRPTLLTQSNSGPIVRALEEARTGYMLRYTATGVSDTGWHPITVTIKRPGSYQVQVRPGYQR